MKVDCPVCGEPADEIDPNVMDVAGMDFSVAESGEIAFAKEVTVIKYEFRPCGHEAIGTQDQEQ